MIFSVAWIYLGQFAGSMLVGSFFPELTLPFPDKKLLHQLIPLGELFLRFVEGVLFVDVGLLKLLLQRPDILSRRSETTLHD
jgi:hypothetical protein